MYVRLRRHTVRGLHMCLVLTADRVLSDDVTKMFSETMGFIRLFRTTFLKKVHTHNIVSLVH